MAIKRLPRRTVLKGALGAAVALPLLECMIDEKGARAATYPQRYLLTFGGFSLNKGSSNGPTPQAFVPNSYGPGYDLKAATAPLGGYSDANGNPVKDVITFVSGLDIPHAVDLATQPPASRYIGDSFHFHTGPLLCGVKQIYELDAEVTGASSDQIVAQTIGGSTLFPYLCYRVQASFYNPLNGAGAGAHHRDTMSFEDVNGTIYDIRPQTSPKQAYDSLFTNFVPTDPAQAAAKAYEIRKRKSILDVVDRSMGGLLPRLGAWDRERMQRHFDEIRAIETLLDAAPPSVSGECKLLPDPGADPPVGGDFGAPFDYNVNLGYSNEEARARIFTRLVHMAFVCDLTRVGTLMYTAFQSFMNAQAISGAQLNQHAVTHNGNQTQMDNLIAWHLDHFAELVSLLRDTPEGTGSVLDNCAVAFIPEGGYRTNPAPVPGGISHNTENMCLLLAGGAGGLKRGEHIQAPASTKHPGQVLISMMKAVGLTSNTLGEVSGYIPELFV